MTTTEFQVPLNNPCGHVQPGFTLVELLVVITIIVVLLAVLTPALDKAVYQAELASCSARLDGIATGVTGYATANKGAYPHRPTLDPAKLGRPPARGDRPEFPHDRWFGRASGGG